MFKLFKTSINKISNAAKYLISAFAVLFGVAHAGIGADIVAKVETATGEANLVYVAVIAAFAAFFVVKLIKKAL